MNPVRTSATRLGFSLLEVVIVLLITSIVMVMTVDSLAAAKSYEAVGAAQDDLYLDGEKCLRQISDDLTVSGWHIADSQLEVSGSLTDNATTDRARRYYPYVIQQCTAAGLTAGQASLFPHCNRGIARSCLTALPATLPGTPSHHTALMGSATAAYVTSYYARSQELIFLRSVAAGWTSNPESVPNQIPGSAFSGTTGAWQVPGNQANLGVLFPSGWIESSPNVFTPRVDADSDGKPDTPYGVTLAGGWLDTSTGDLRIMPQWETVEAPTYTAVNDDELREYTYAVVPTTQGYGRLLRAYKRRYASTPTVQTAPPYNLGAVIAASGSYGMVVDRILSDNVVRVIFDTCRTEGSLAVNQVRVRLYLARQALTRDRMVFYRTLETTVTMRTKNNEYWSDQDRARIGSGPIGFPYPF